MPKFSIIEGKLTLSKELNYIDEFVLKAIKILTKYTDYVIVSGYVAIFFGRSRGSEDVDIFLKELPLERFQEMYRDLAANGFAWTIDNPDELYQEYLMQGTPIGVWEKDFPLLRIDMKFPKELSQRNLFTDRIKVLFDNHAIWMANIESTIAYKEEIARSEKDILDAKHLRLVFEGLNPAKIESYKKLFHQEFNR
jgi:predicted nucleotidyltransferase